MIAYQELLTALVTWRRRQGLPVSAKFANVAPPTAPEAFDADAPTNFAAPAYHPPISPATRRTSTLSAVNIDAAPPAPHEAADAYAEADPDGLTLMGPDDLAPPPPASPAAPGYSAYEHTLAFGSVAASAPTPGDADGIDIEDPDATVASMVGQAELDALKLRK